MFPSLVMFISWLIISTNSVAVNSLNSNDIFKDTSALLTDCIVSICVTGCSIIPSLIYVVNT